MCLFLQRPCPLPFLLFSFLLFSFRWVQDVSECHRFFPSFFGMLSTHIVFAGSSQQTLHQDAFKVKVLVLSVALHVGHNVKPLYIVKVWILLHTSWTVWRKIKRTRCKWMFLCQKLQSKMPKWFSAPLLQLCLDIMFTVHDNKHNFYKFLVWYGRKNSFGTPLLFKAVK